MTNEARASAESREGSATQTSPSQEWSISDRVIRLRQIGADKLYALPELGSLQRRRPRRHTECNREAVDDDTPVVAFEESYLLGSLATCHIPIEDPKGQISKRHARLYDSGEAWHILDLGSKNGLVIDGVKQLGARLSPGMVIGVGSVRLIAESSRSIDLRCYLCRVLGWGWDDSAAAQAVERALQTLRAAQLQREPLWIQGSGEDALQVAQDLHRYLFGRKAPFVMCDPRRKSESDTARQPGNKSDFSAAIAAARGGTVCMRSCRLPEGFLDVLESLRRAEDPLANLVVCDDVAQRERPGFAGHSLLIPPLAKRPSQERANVVREYFFDAMATLKTTVLPRPEDRAWILKHCATSLQDVAKGTERLLSLRLHRNFHVAAEALNMTRPSLFRWLQRRELPSWLADDAIEERAEAPEGESAE